MKSIVDRFDKQRNSNKRQAQADPGNPFELFTDHPDFEQANAELQRTVELAIDQLDDVLSPDGVAQTIYERWVEEVAEKWAQVGADDTMAREAIYLKILEAVRQRLG